MQIVDRVSFFEDNRQRMFYVGFLKSASETWFPLCMVSGTGSDSSQAPKLDTLFVSPSYGDMAQVVQDCAGEIPQVMQTFVQYLMAEEIENLMERYALERMALILPEAGEGGCGCGCDCH